MMNIKPKKRAERGFTLIEIMVVVAIIGILAAIGMPTLFAYIRSAETTEAMQHMERINKAVKGLASQRIGGAAEAVAIVNNNSIVAPGSSLSLVEALPHLFIDTDANWTYVVDARQNGNDIEFCINATAGANTGNTGRRVMMSSTLVVNDPQWENYINRQNFVASIETTNLNAGGHCTTAGGYQ